MSSTTKRLTKSSYDRKLAGVCGGLAHHFDLDPTVVRVLFAVLTFFMLGIGGVLLYIILAMIMPEA